jgi:general secretion pathway protein D
LLGSLFRYRTSSKSKRNLMVFLHPTILRDPDTADFYSRSKYDDLRAAQLGLFEEGDDIAERIRPELPELHLYFDGKRVDSRNTQLNTILPTSDANGSITMPGGTTELPARASVDAGNGPEDALPGRTTANSR